MRKLIAASLSLAAALITGLAAEAADIVKGDIRITQPWSRATPAGAKVAAGYLAVTNTGKTADRLVGGTAASAGVFELHDMTMTDGVMRMRRIEGGIELKPGATVRLQPGGMHVMFMELKQPLKQGERIKGTLVFEKAGTVEIEYEVAGIGAGPPGAGSQGGGHKGH